MRVARCANIAVVSTSWLSFMYEIPPEIMDKAMTAPKALASFALTVNLIFQPF
jgi:hypothetical protein